MNIASPDIKGTGRVRQGVYTFCRTPLCFSGQVGSCPQTGYERRQGREWETVKTTNIVVIAADLYRERYVNILGERKEKKIEKWA